MVGGSNPHGDRLEEEVHRVGSVVRLLRNASNMPELMAEADVAISAQALLVGKCAFSGLPAIIIDVAENQRPVAQELSRLGVAIHAGSVQDMTSETIAAKLKLLLDSAELRAEMSRRGRELVDGRGADRVVSAMRPRAHAPEASGEQRLPPAVAVGQ